MIQGPKIDPTLLPVESIARAGKPAPAQTEKPSGGFDAVLRQEISGLKFSAHAQERLDRRGIELTTRDLERLKEAVGRVEEKGGKDSLVLLDDKAFLVSVKNKTVITALAGAQVKEGVFTKIDSAVVI